MNGVFYAVRADMLYPRQVQNLVSCKEICDERTWFGAVEESPLLKSVTMKQLVQTVADWKDLACALVICEVWGSAMTL
jgi:hypothetical protein